MLADLRSYLEANTGIQTAGVTRVYPLSVPQKAALPAIVYRQTGHERDYTQDGNSGLHKATVVLAIGATSFDSVSTIGAAVVAALDAYRGLMGTTNIQSIFIEDEADDLTISADNAAAKVFGKEITLSITYR